jgi:hypothetical protein
VNNHAQLFARIGSNFLPWLTLNQLLPLKYLGLQVCTTMPGSENLSFKGDKMGKVAENGSYLGHYL